MKIIRAIIAVFIMFYLLLVLPAYLPREVIPARMLADQESRFIQVDGHTIHFKQQGQGDPIILVHGFAGSTYTWRHLIPLLESGHTVYALDLLGFGLSDKPADAAYDLASQADLVLGFMDALHLSTATLVGHSMGGVVAGYAAVKAPSKVRDLLLVAPGFYFQGAPGFLKYNLPPLGRLLARAFYTRYGRAQALNIVFYNKAMVTDELVDRYLAPGKTPGAIEAMACMLRTVAPRTYEGISIKIKCPTLIVWGREDAAVPVSDGARLRQEISGSQLIIFDQCGHMVQEEKPAELASIINGFFAPSNNISGGQ
jgi:pimeloyl-ACP methyl ester carboxylesterase